MEIEDKYINVKSQSFPEDDLKSFQDREVYIEFYKKYLEKELDRLVEVRGNMKTTRNTLIKSNAKGVENPYAERRMRMLKSEFEALQTSLVILRLMYDNEPFIDYFRSVLEEVHEKSEYYKVNIMKNRT